MITVKAPAKVNVGLWILGRRDDGYHEIWTILQQIPLTDEIALQAAPDLSLSVRGTDVQVPQDHTNLCLMAACLLQETTGSTKGARIDLKKVIPVGAGLGGGSSDAAATLVGLNQLWNAGLSNPDLESLAVRLGSDVPFFIRGNCCVATGRGEILQTRDQVITDPVVLVCPDVKISTMWAYKNLKKYNLTSERESIIFQSSFRGNLSDPAIKSLLTNDFETLVFDQFPSLCELKTALLDASSYYASLSGSRSSVFGVFQSLDESRKALVRLPVKERVYLLES
jgi:4-diphosphocytidyl-2-C-methyl-D-erythritol kinase